jgi:hypothetical protein
LASLPSAAFASGLSATSGLPSSGLAAGLAASGLTLAASFARALVLRLRGGGRDRLRACAGPALESLMVASSTTMSGVMPFAWIERPLGVK